MPVEVDINSQKFNDQYNNGESLNTNQTEFTYNLVGSVMEYQRVLLEISVYSYYTTTAYDKFTVEDLGGDKWKFKKNTGGFRVDGFSVGDTLIIIPLVTPGSPVAGVVESITSTWMTVQFAAQPVNLDDQCTIANTTQPTALIYSPNLIGNDENFNISSKVSGNDCGYYLAGISAIYQNMIGLGQYEGFNSGNPQVKYDSTDGLGFFNFSIIDYYLIAPFYLDGWDDFVNGIGIPSLYNGLASLKYVLECDFRTVLSNPNTSKIGRNEVLLGSTAWFNENFNGFDNNYSINSISYEEAVSGDNADALIIGTRTKVTILLNKVIGTFDAADRLGFYVSYLPGVSEYQNVITDMQTNFIFDNRVFDATSVASVGAGIIKSIQSTVLNPTTVEIIAEVEYDVAQQLRLSANSQYIIGVGASSSSFTAGNSDRVIILADYRNYDINADISGLMGVSNFSLQLYDDVFTPIETWTSLFTWNEDGFRCAFRFWLDTNLDAFINSLDFVLVAYNDSTDDFFELDKYSFNVGSAIVSGGIQQLIIDETRGYKLSTDTDPAKFNEASIALNSLTAGKQYYDVLIGQKISWQDWMENLNVPFSFFDSSQPQNNRNLKSSNYAGFGGYTIRVGLKANVYGTNSIGQSGLTDYLFLTPLIEVYNYDESAEWTAVIETFHPTTGANLGGAVLTNEDTLFRTTWTNTTGAVTSLLNTYVEHGIQNTGENGYNTHISTTMFHVATNNKLGEMSALQIVAGDIISECTIDGSLIDSPQDLTAKIIKTIPIIKPVKLMEDGTVKTDEAGTDKEIE